MKKNWIKMTAMAALAGTMFQFGGCGVSGIFRSLLRTAPIALGIEFLTDNNSVFDLFPDGGTTTAP